MSRSLIWTTVSTYLRPTVTGSTAAPEQRRTPRRPGNDRAFGDDGADFIPLAVGDDYGSGGLGNDTVIGGFGRDTIDAGPGRDAAAGGPDADTISGGPGDDELFGQLPPGPPPPVAVPPARDVCNGNTGFDRAAECDVRFAIEAVLAV